MLEETDVSHSTKYSCFNCKKQYTRKSSLDNHKLLCDYKMKTKREHQIEEEELGDLPNHLQLVKIVQDLSMSLIRMEEQMSEMKKWVDKKKKKLNVILWLNSNSVPTIGYKEWLDTQFVVLPEHFEHLTENTLFQNIQQVFEYNLQKKADFEYPLKCFCEKQGLLYICEKKEDGTPDWKQMDFPDTILLFKVYYNRMMKVLTAWKLENQHKFDDNTKLCDLFNKGVIKLMGLSFTQDASFSRIKNGLYNYLKMDLKATIEYEFEF